MNFRIFFETDIVPALGVFLVLLLMEQAEFNSHCAGCQYVRDWDMGLAAGELRVPGKFCRGEEVPALWQP